MFAVRAMWLWVGWTALYGAYQAWFTDTAALQPLVDQLAPFYPVTTQTLQPLTAVGYAVAALSIAWLTAKLANRKRWARTSLVVSLLVQALWTAGQVPDLAQVLSNIPDLVLQSVTLWFLFTPPARAWFSQRA